jgi:hypothetical protein
MPPEMINRDFSLKNLTKFEKSAFTEIFKEIPYKKINSGVSNEQGPVYDISKRAAVGA